jgi:predicted GTPase
MDLSGQVSLNSDQEREIRQRVEAERNKPLIVVVMGQTGVGKSSLINALFGTKLKTNDVQPETKFPEKHIERGSDGYELWFWDMPGIGESSSADAGYLHDYRQKILEADVALWLCHADSRSVTFDVEAIQKILADLTDGEQSIILSKLTFVLSKSDLITPEPWFLCKTKNEAIFETSEVTEKLLDAKAAYFREALIAPYGNKFVSRTFHDGTFQIRSGNLTFDKNFAYYSGVMSISILRKLKQDYPEQSNVFNRLYLNSEVVYCSSRFRYNLSKLMQVIVDKIGGGVSIRFRNFISKGAMNRVSWSKAQTFSNLVVLDSVKDEIVFDLSNVN